MLIYTSLHSVFGNYFANLVSQLGYYCLLMLALIDLNVQGDACLTLFDFIQWLDRQVMLNKLNKAGQ